MLYTNAVRKKIIPFVETQLMQFASNEAHTNYLQTMRHGPTPAQLHKIVLVDSHVSNLLLQLQALIHNVHALFLRAKCKHVSIYLLISI